MKHISGEESERRWKMLTARNQSTLNSSQTGGAKHQEADPFNCSDLVVPTSQALVDESVNKAVKQWKDLEQRKVLSANAQVVSSNQDQQKCERRFTL